ncbi:translesion DNA synthesis-associated protein ImuA [Alteromonadaceae bacterium M269]|nr:translesion DNA synthesis-associated protein ImuA [Alteromonadaceae bacterium M269]
MNTTLHELESKRLIWKARQTSEPYNACMKGFEELDENLNGGLPEQGVIDIHSPLGIGELRLILPYLRERLYSQSLNNPDDKQTQRHSLVFIAPPMRVNSEMLAEFKLVLSKVLVIHPSSSQEALWAAEQCLKSGCCKAVLLWHKQLEIHQVKRLQLAAQKGDAINILFRQTQESELSLPVSLSLSLSPHEQGLKVEITKQKGHWPKPAFSVNMSKHWPELTVKQRPNNVLPFPVARVS